ncbi:MAG: acetoin:2,6-dichlorophenolindophenol oxidoreductase subunit beta [Mycobacterium sp.]|jgi:pyruvate/2-oxoglutarate/acetoin dehydrogenase E1 component|nr:acetoin:2,6-dichlorophenolindophenol oxidoreductase subunit beta [Mycobacterium sp.]
MTKMNYLAALVGGIVEEMRRDELVFAMGQDIRSGTYGPFPIDEFSPGRIRDLPISEAANLGSAIGAALTGMRPVIDITNANFLYSAMDQIVNQAAKIRYMFGGQASVPVVIRSQLFYVGSKAAHHGDRPYPAFMNVPGLKIIAPSTPADAKGLITAAIRDPDPVLSFEDGNLWGTREDVPDGEYVVPLGVADVKRPGSDVTIVGVANGVRLALAAARELEKDGISAEVVDPRTLVPFDWETVFNSVGRTGRLVVVDPACRTCGAASEIVASVLENCFENLTSAPIRVTAADVPMPFSPELEREVLPSRDRVIAAARSAVTGSSAKSKMWAGTGHGV